MWNYEKRLQYPINITTPNAKIAQIIMSQYGGPDGEMGASMRYLSQRYSMPDRRVCGVLTDIGTEELAHRCWIWKRPVDKLYRLCIFILIIELNKSHKLKQEIRYNNRNQDTHYIYNN